MNFFGFCIGLEQMGIAYRVGKTKRADWQRVHILDCDGVEIGVSSFWDRRLKPYEWKEAEERFNGNQESLKWHQPQPPCSLRAAADFAQQRVNKYVHDRTAVSKDLVFKLRLAAESIVEAEHEANKQWRLMNPKKNPDGSIKVDKHGIPSRRKPLTKRDPEKLLDLLLRRFRDGSTVYGVPERLRDYFDCSKVLFKDVVKIKLQENQNG